jgi:hypothetical protein
MPKFFVLLLAAYSLAAAGQTTQVAAGSSEANMPREKAEATFKDPRLLAFLKNVMEGFKESCTPPDPANTKAKVTLPNIAKDAPLDAAGLASTWYEVAVPCSDVTTVIVHAEFTQLSGDKPLTLVLSLNQVFKR